MLTFNKRSMIEEYFSIQLSGDHRIALPLANVETVMRLQRQVIVPFQKLPHFGWELLMKGDH